jgi:hypothetical protein
MLHSISYLVIIIGFTKTNYTVDEDFGTLQIEIRVLNPPDNQPLPASIILKIQSVSGLTSTCKCTEPVYLKVLMLYIIIH